MNKNKIKICQACGITSAIDSDLMYNIEIEKQILFEAELKRGVFYGK